MAFGGRFRGLGYGSNGVGVGVREDFNGGQGKGATVVSGSQFRWLANPSAVGSWVKASDSGLKKLLVWIGGGWGGRVGGLCFKETHFLLECRVVLGREGLEGKFPGGKVLVQG